MKTRDPPWLASPNAIPAPAWAALAGHLEATLDAEREATARILHDELGGLLVAARMDLGDLQRCLAGREQLVLEHAQRAQQDLELAIATGRRLAESLQPGLLVHVGPIAALRAYLESESGQNAPRVHAYLPEEEANLTLQRRTALYRAVKEAIEYACTSALGPITLTIILAPDRLTARLAPLAATETCDPRLLAISHRLQPFDGTLEFSEDERGLCELVMVLPAGATEK